jgi:sulfate permease, SulP family
MGTFFSRTQRFLPFLGWLRGYQRRQLRADFFAGLSVALVLIPQSMAYAQLAGLPAHFGLYAALLPPVVGALFGSSRQLATGPVAVVSLMTAATLEPLATSGSEAYVAYAILLALVVGLFQFLLGVFRLGLVVNLLSHPVVNGFTNAAVLIIVASQLPRLFGVSVEGGGHPLAALPALVRVVFSQGHWPTMAMALLAFALMVGSRRCKVRLPAILLVVLLTTSLSWALGFSRQQQIGLDDLAGAGVGNMVVAVNSGVLEVERFTEERLRLSEEIAALEKSGAGGPAGLLLAVRQQQERLDFALAEKRQEVQGRRDALRELRFVAAQGEEGLRYVVLSRAGGLPEPAPARTWRLQVGNGLLDSQDLLLVGGGAVVGAVSPGLPSLRMPELEMQALRQILPYALIIALLGFMESISVARAMAARTGQKLDANQELIGQGLANMAGSFAGSYPVSGSFSRSAVTLQAGGVSGLANVLSAFFVLITLLFFTPLLHHLPQAVLAAVIIVAVLGLMHPLTFLHAWRAQKSDGVIALLTFAATLACAPHLDRGIAVGVLLSLGVFLHKKMRPRVSTLAMSREGVLQCASEHGLQLCVHIAAVRFDGTLFFANAGYLEEQVFRIRSSNQELRYLLLVADGINDMDASGAETLGLMVKRLHSAGQGFAMCRVKEEVMAVLRRTGLLELIGENNIHAGEETALAEIIRKTHHPGSSLGKGCLACPLVHHLPREAADAGEAPEKKWRLLPLARARRLALQVVGPTSAGS